VMSYPKTSAAAVLTKYNEPVEVHEVAIPELEPDAILVRVEVSTVCGTDVHIYEGDFQHVFSKLPLIMGHEIVGRIAALGRNRRRDATGQALHEGDLVAWSYAWCGTCYYCNVVKQPTLCRDARMYGYGPLTEPPHLTGGFAEYCYILPRCGVVKVPDKLDPATAASGTCALRTVVHGYEKIGALSAYDTVLIQGSGPIGLYALAYAVQAGVARVICIGAPWSRLAIARKWGANDLFSIEETSAEQRREAILKLTDGRGADLVIECSGFGIALAEGIELVRPGGRYLVIGQSDPRPAQIRGTYLNHRQLTVMGVNSAEIGHYYKALKFLSDHQDRFSFADLLGQRYSLSHVNEALCAMKEMRETKPIIVPS